MISLPTTGLMDIRTWAIEAAIRAHGKQTTTDITQVLATAAKFEAFALKDDKS